jgi:hypothetical protein
MNRGADAVMESLRAEAGAALEKLAGLDAEAADKARAVLDACTDATQISTTLGKINAGVAKRLNEASALARTSTPMADYQGVDPDNAGQT